MSAVDVIIRTGDTHAIEHHFSCRRHGEMRALTLVADRQLAIADPPTRGKSRRVFGKIVAGL
jgi:hypothetical protein